MLVHLSDPKTPEVPVDSDGKPKKVSSGEPWFTFSLFFCRAALFFFCCAFLTILFVDYSSKSSCFGSRLQETPHGCPISRRLLRFSWCVFQIFISNSRIKFSRLFFLSFDDKLSITLNFSMIKFSTPLSDVFKNTRKSIPFLFFTIFYFSR